MSKRESVLFLIGSISGVGLSAIVSLLISLAKEEIIDILARAKERQNAQRK